eukprot:gene6804-7518_t
MDNSPDRFYVELEFIQNLANARYLHYLAIQGYLEDSKFLSFLSYLRYWKAPNYAQHLLFPQCLVFLDALIEDAHFRKELLSPAFMEFLHQQQGLGWMHGRDWLHQPPPAQPLTSPVNDTAAGVMDV